MTERQLIRLLTAGRGKVIATDVPFSVVRVHDGDTLYGHCPGWSPPWDYWLIRLYGVDAPELHDKRPAIQKIALQALDAFKALVSVKDSYLPTVRGDKFLRIDCTIKTPVTPDVGAEMNARGLTRAYFGEGPKPW